MNVKVDTTVRGKFVIYDKDGNQIAEKQNMITNYGMHRIAGYYGPDCLTNEYGERTWISNWQSICDNFRHMFVGQSDEIDTANTGNPSSLGEKNYKMGNPYVSPYVTMTINKPKTDTEFVRDEDNNFLVRHKIARDVTFTGPATVKEIGLSHVPKVGSSGAKRGNESYDISRTDHLDNVRYSLFCRAVLDDPITINSGGPDEMFTVVYVFEMSIACGDKIFDTIPFDNEYVSDPLSIMPANRTNVRQYPVYPVTVTTTNNVNNLNLPVWPANYTGTAPSTYATPPLLEALGRGTWRLDVYSNVSGVDFGTFSSTTTAVEANQSATVPFPVQSVRVVPSSGGTPLTKSYITYGSNPTVATEMGVITPKKVIKSWSEEQNIWSTELRFLVKISRLNNNNNGFEAFALNRTINTSYQINQSHSTGGDLTKYSGVLTIMDGEYNPPKGPTNNYYWGVDYMLIFTRG